LGGDVGGLKYIRAGIEESGIRKTPSELHGKFSTSELDHAIVLFGERLRGIVTPTALSTTIAAVTV
jgi:hypothetical protein